MGASLQRFLRDKLRVSEIVVLKSTQKGLLGYEKHPKYLGRAFENTCAEVKNKDLVCAKKKEIHANNSKVKIKYV